MNDAIYLTPEEIERIHKVKLDGTLATIRDRFVIGCVTGLRYSDYSRFGPGHLKSGVITILTQKTNRKVVIPAHRLVIDILKRNRNDIPKAPTLRYFNMMLPTIGLKAGIKGDVQIESIQNEEPDGFAANDLISDLGSENTKRKVISKVVPKFELITTHTARRSFATNAYLGGIKPAKIMLITGHTTENSFFRYIRIAAAQNAEELKSHHFFN